MKLVTPVIAGAAVLALANVALAEEPMALTDAQMDSITAGGVDIKFSLTGDAFGNGTFRFDNLPGVFSNASASASITPVSGTVNATLRVAVDTDD